MADQERRKRLLVNESFQLSFIAFTSLLSFLVIGVFYGVTRMFLLKLQNRGVEAGLEPDHVFLHHIADQKPVLDMIFATGSLFSFLILLCGGLFLSHRVAGPVEKLRRHMIGVAKGEEKPGISFRKSDYFHDLADAYNLQMGVKDSLEEKPDSP